MANKKVAVGDTAKTIKNIKDDIKYAIGNDLGKNCVGVMIQYGKMYVNSVEAGSSKNPLKLAKGLSKSAQQTAKSWSKTRLGGHVSPFVITKDDFHSWDQLELRWNKTIGDEVDEGSGLLIPSGLNDVTIYVHKAQDTEIQAVMQRADRLLEQPMNTYHHKPRIGDSVVNKGGDCVTSTSWVMAAFSYTPPWNGGLTPWGLAAIYEAYASIANPISNWYKVKYTGAKLPVMW